MLYEQTDSRVLDQPKCTTIQSQMYLKKLKQNELEEFRKTPFNLLELMEKHNRE